VAKLILVVLGLLLVYWIVRGYRRRVDRKSAPAPRSEDMVPCAHCGVHLPRGESVAQSGAFYCSAEHERLHQRR
jgi:uncharacterized protein